MDAGFFAAKKHKERKTSLCSLRSLAAIQPRSTRNPECGRPRPRPLSQSSTPKAFGVNSQPTTLSTYFASVAFGLASSFGLAASRLASQSRDCASPPRLNSILPLIVSPLSLPLYLLVTVFPPDSRVT